MRRILDPDADPAGQPADTGAAPPEAAEPRLDATAEPTDAADPSVEDNTAPSLVWPPVEDELNEWEVMPIHSTGHTIIEPMKFTPPAPAASATPPADASASGERAFTPPPTPAPYVPPPPIDDPVGETSLLASDFDLPETELIEPLTLQPTPHREPARPVAATAPDPEPDEGRTLVLPRPATWGRSDTPGPAVVPPPAKHPPQPADDTHSGATRVIVAPNFAASLGHAPTVPVSALHRAARPQPAFGPRNPLEETLPAGVTRDMLAGTGDRGGDDTNVPSAAQGDTHPVPSPVARRAAVPASPPGPFSRVPSRGPQPHVTPDAAADPAPISLAPPPLAFGPRVPASSSSGSIPAMAPPPAAAPTSAAAAREPFTPVRPAPTSTGRKIASLGVAVAAVLLLALGAYQVMSMRSTSAAAPSTATLSVESTPAGATVSIDGTERGKTPLRIDLPEGGHALDVTLGEATRKVPLTLAAGTITAHSFEFATPVAPVAADAAVEIRTEPAGARVLVDGVARGVTPIVVTGLTAGRHEVQVSGPFRPITRQVNLIAKQQTRLVIAPAPSPTGADGAETRPARAAAGTGFIAIESPIVLRVVRNGDFVGTSEDARLSLPVGPQVIGLENESVGFRDVRTVEVVAGKVTPVPVSLPKGEISINARPWAEVFVDGSRVGETPVSQLSLPVGIHEITFRHPEHGERRVSVVVKIGATGRAFTDFTK